MDDKEGRAARYEQRRQFIMTQAAMLLRRGQQVGFSVDDLCAALRINKSTFYRYFRTKEHLLYTLHQSAMDDLDRMLSKALETQGSVVDKLAAAITGHVLLQQKTGVSALAIPQTGTFSARNRRLVIKRRDEYEAKFRMLIQRGIDEGIFRQCDPAIQSILLLSMLNSIQTWYKEGGSYSPEQLARIIVEGFLNGLIRRRDEIAPASPELR